MPIDTQQLANVALSDTFNTWREKTNEIIKEVNRLPAVLYGPLTRIGGVVDGETNPNMEVKSGSQAGILYFIGTGTRGIGIGDYLGATENPTTITGDFQIFKNAGESALSLIHI